MDHTEAIQESYVEKYLLDELSPAQRDSFEDHFFDCSICADDVHAGAVFIDNTKSLLRSEEAAAPAQKQLVGWHRGFGLPFRASALASLVLLMLVGYQNIVTIPGLQSNPVSSRVPEIPQRISFAGVGSRAESQGIVIPHLNNVELDFEVPGGPDFASYTIKILDSKGDLKFSLPISSEQAKDEVPLMIPAGFLSVGNYAVEIAGNRSGELEQKLILHPVTVK